MEIVTIDELNQHIEDYNDDLNDYKLQKIGAAIDIVQNYLGYNLELTSYTEQLKGDLIALKAKPIKTIASLKVNGVERVQDVLSIEDNIVRISGLTRKSIIDIEYDAGYEIEVPSIIKEVVLRKASELFKENGNNANMNSLSSPDGISRTFTWPARNKDLSLLSKYRVVRLLCLNQ